MRISRSRLRVSRGPTNRSGGNGSLTPDLSGLVGWYKGDVGVTQIANLVSKWADQSGSGNDLTASLTACPTLVPSGLNGLPYILFNGTTNILNNTSFALGSTATSVFMVCRNHSSAAACAYSYNSLSPSLAYSVGSAGLGSLFIGYAQGATSIVSTLNSWSRSTTIARTAMTQEIWTNGSDAQTSALLFTATASGPFALGNRSDAALPCQIDIAECLVYNTDKTSNRASIEAYLTAKWGI